MNIQKAIDKLDEYNPIFPFTKDVLKGALLALQEPEDDKPDHWGYRVKIDNLNKRVGRLESKKGELEGKVARLEEAHKTDGEFIMKALEARGIVVRKPEPSNGQEAHFSGCSSGYGGECDCRGEPSSVSNESMIGSPMWKRNEVAHKKIDKGEAGYIPEPSSVSECKIDEQVVMREKQIAYSIALQRSIEYHCKGLPVPYGIMIEAPHHAQMLNDHLSDANENKSKLPCPWASNPWCDKCLMHKEQCKCELKTTTTSEVDDKICEYCGGLKAIRNPNGKCDHLYYPELVNKSLKHSPKTASCLADCGLVDEVDTPKPSAEKCETITISRSKFDRVMFALKEYKRVSGTTGMRELLTSIEALSNINGKGE